MDYRYSLAGGWSESVPSVDFPEGCDVHEEYRKNGYSETISFGSPSGFSVTLFSSDRTSENPNSTWLVEISTGFEGCCVKVYDWPSLIDLLGKLTPICSAGAFITPEGGSRILADIAMPIIHVENRTGRMFEG